MIHDDLLFIAPNHDIATKTMDFEAHRSGNMKGARLNTREPRIHLIGDNATVIADVDLRVEFYGEHPEGGIGTCASGSGLEHIKRLSPAAAANCKLLPESCNASSVRNRDLYQ